MALLSGVYCSTVKSRFNEWPPSAPVHSLNRDFTLNRDFLKWNFILVTSFCSLNRDSLHWDFTVLTRMLQFFRWRAWSSWSSWAGWWWWWWARRADARGCEWRLCEPAKTAKWRTRRPRPRTGRCPCPWRWRWRSSCPSRTGRCPRSAWPRVPGGIPPPTGSEAAFRPRGSRPAPDRRRRRHRRSGPT